jgi:hypothetical protein
MFVQLNAVLSVSKLFCKSVLKTDNCQYADMHLILGEAGGNSVAAVRLCAEGYIQRTFPDPRKFQATDRRIRMTGTARPCAVDGEVHEQLIWKSAYWNV